MPISSRRMGLERHFGRAHHHFRQGRCVFGDNPRCSYSSASSRRSASGSRRRAASLDIELPVEELPLRRHRDVFSSSHGERPGKEARKACQTHIARPRLSAENTKDQRHIGHKAVAHPEHRSASGARLDVAVMVLDVLVLLGVHFASTSPRGSRPCSGCPRSEAPGSPASWLTASSQYRGPPLQG